MCFKCMPSSRRGFMSLAAGGLLAAGLPAKRSAAATTLSPTDALAKLIQGNNRFITSPDVCARDLSAQRGAVAKGQSPWAVILTCSDSRVSPELIFGGVGLGELFVARNAGNMADTATMGTVEYGVEHLGAPLVVVLGHERCGAVATACEVAEKKTKLPGSIGPMVDTILPAAQAMMGKPGDFVDNTVRESARRTATKIKTTSPVISEIAEHNKVTVLAAYYDLDTGVVTYIS